VSAELVEHFRGYPVRWRRVEVAGRKIELLSPANHESLIDDPLVEARYERDEYMPYWAELWPASLLLADAVAGWGPAEVPGEAPSVLELGCGLGVVSLVALQLGYAVTASDYDDDALAFVVESARRNGLPQPETRRIDWRKTYPGLRFDRIVAADVLYETRNLRPMAEFVRAHLRSDGVGLLCDTNRPTADNFDRIARECELSVVIEPVERPGAADEPIVRGRIFHLCGVEG
jgi:2-polyprenyl-3-methyl-5-hydroxy-6-metoxy-1,4-benzoquinol methylase